MTDREVSAWHGATVEVWRGRWGVPRLHVFETVGSTNDVARELASAGAPQGTTVLADQQTRGRGRRGRAWHSDTGQSLLLSMIARPGDPGADAIGDQLRGTGVEFLAVPPAPCARCVPTRRAIA